MTTQKLVHKLQGERRQRGRQLRPPELGPVDVNRDKSVKRTSCQQRRHFFTPVQWHWRHFLTATFPHFPHLTPIYHIPDR